MMLSQPCVSSGPPCSACWLRDGGNSCSEGFVLVKLQRHVSLPLILQSCCCVGGSWYRQRQCCDAQAEAQEQLAMVQQKLEQMAELATA